MHRNIVYNRITLHMKLSTILQRNSPCVRYEINDLKDRCRDKLLDFFIALRREIEDEDLHIRTHYSSIRIIMFDKRNEGSSNSQ